MSIKNKIVTSSIREIKSSYKRFISLLIMSLLGVSVFVGLSVSAPNMIRSLDTYYDENNYYDIKIISTTGLTNKDIDAINKLKTVKKAYGAYSKDAIIKLNDSQLVTKIIGISQDVNKITVTKGSLPKNDNEIVVEDFFLQKENLKIGDTIELLNDSIFKNKELKIVGTVKSPFFIANATSINDRGNTSLGTGNISYYAYVNNDNFNMNYYSEVYVVVDNAKSMITNSSEYNDLIDDAKYALENEFNNVNSQLNKIPESKWYLYDRMDNTDYYDYINDVNSVSNLSKVFPTIFFAVAILISLISMSRMVEEDRTLIGTLKSLGFSNKHIKIKYLLYSGLATIIGGVLGSIIGFFVLPVYIWNIYKILFEIPKLVINYDFTYVLIGISISTICICGTTLLTIKKMLKEKPSDLMRPKAPTNGKRILLEKISFIWKKLRFSNKIMLRNVFRYKKRAIITITAIAGCTALMLSGFGIRDSIIDIASTQYGKIFTFDEMVYLGNRIEDSKMDDLFQDNVNDYLKTKMDVVKVKNYSVNLFVPDDNDKLSKFVNLRELKTNNKLALKNNKIIISDKLAYLTDTKVGDTLKFVSLENKEYDFVVSGICENYVGQYIFIDKDTYEKNIGKYDTNVVYLKLSNIKKEEILSKSLLEDDNVINVISISSSIKNIENMFKSLNSVVFILILLSGILSFVILYNLSYINISERTREIATLKVLGFTNKEVDNYINKETIILTLIGIIFGLVFGIFLTNLIIDTVEIEIVRFIRNINISSFVISATMMIIFTLVMLVITHYALKKINMIESLKSVE